MTPAPELTATFQRPVKAKLMVFFDNGESATATEEHLRQFGFVRSVPPLGLPPTRFHEFVAWLRRVMDDISESEAVRLAEEWYSTGEPFSFDRTPPHYAVIPGEEEK